MKANEEMFSGNADAGYPDVDMILIQLVKCFLYKEIKINIDNIQLVG